MIANTPKMTVIPSTQLTRVKRTRTKNGVTLREWFYTDIPKADLLYDADGRAIEATLTVEMDVPSKPRTTQRSTWSPIYQNYIAWRSAWHKAIRFALDSAGFAIEKNTIFSSVLEDEPAKGRSKAVYTPPLIVSGLIRTKLQGDTDNKAKSILDAGNSLLYPDDRLVAWSNFLVLPAGDGPTTSTITVQWIPQGERREKLLALHGAIIARARPSKLATPPEVVDLFEVQ